MATNADGADNGIASEIDTCPAGDPRCPGPDGGERLECFACYRARRDAIPISRTNSLMCRRCRAIGPTPGRIGHAADCRHGGDDAV